MPIYYKCNRDCNQFKEMMNSLDLLGAIDNEVELDDKEAYNVAHDIWMELELVTKSNGKGIFPMSITLICSKLG